MGGNWDEMRQLDLFFEMGWFNHQPDTPFEAISPHFCRNDDGFFPGSVCWLHTGWWDKSPSHSWMNFEDGSNESYHMSWKGFERSSQVVYAIQRLSLAGGWGSSHLGNDVEFDGKWSLTCWLRWHPKFVGQNFWLNEKTKTKSDLRELVTCLLVTISRFCKHFFKHTLPQTNSSNLNRIDAILKGKSSNPQFSGAMLLSYDKKICQQLIANTFFEESLFLQYFFSPF